MVTAQQKGITQRHLSVWEHRNSGHPMAANTLAHSSPKVTQNSCYIWSEFESEALFWWMVQIGQMQAILIESLLFVFLLNHYFLFYYSWAQCSFPLWIMSQWPMVIEERLYIFFRCYWYTKFENHWSTTFDMGGKRMDVNVWKFMNTKITPFLGHFQLSRCIQQKTVQHVA